MKRIGAMLCVFCLLCCCTAQPSPAPRAEAPTATGAGAAQSLAFVVDNRLDPVFLAGAEAFAQRVSELSNGSITITVYSMTGALAYIAADSAQFAFLDSGWALGSSGYLGGLADAFLYNGYEKFSMAVNSEELLLLLREEVQQAAGAVPLAAYYMPGKHFISNWQPSDYNSLGMARIATEAAGHSAKGFEQLGAQVLVEPDAALRAALLLNGQVDAAELTLKEIASTNWQGANYYLTFSFHTARPVYLVVEDSVYNELSPQAKAAILEGAACMYAEIDRAFIEEERVLLTQTAEKGLLFSLDFSSIRSMISALREQEDEAPERQFIRSLVKKQG